MYSITTSKLDLNDTNYLEFYLGTLADDFISRYKDTTAIDSMNQLKELLETTIITNHFDYIAFSKKALSLVNFVLEHPPSKV